MILSHIHKSRFWCLLDVLCKISDDQSPLSLLRKIPSRGVVIGNGTSSSNTLLI